MSIAFIDWNCAIIFDGVGWLGGIKNQMICLKVDIPKELNDIDDELKAIYHSRDTVCFFIFKTRNERNEFVERTKGMNKTDREKIYQEYL